jgi:hypothetical protein
MTQTTATAAPADETPLEEEATAPAPKRRARRAKPTDPAPEPQPVDADGNPIPTPDEDDDAEEETPSPEDETPNPEDAAGPVMTDAEVAAAMPGAEDTTPELEAHDVAAARRTDAENATGVYGHAETADAIRADVVELFGALPESWVELEHPSLLDRGRALVVARRPFPTSETVNLHHFDPPVTATIGELNGWYAHGAVMWQGPSLTELVNA